MKQFIIRISIVLLMVLLTLGTGEYLSRNYTYSDYAYKHKYILHHGEEIKTLILGSSHAYQGINPNALPDAFNLSNSAQPILYDYELLKHYNSQLTNLDNVLLSISYFTFRSAFEQVTYDWQKTAYKVYMDVPYYPDWSKYNFICSYMPLFRTVLASLVRNECQFGCDNLGFKARSIDERLDGWDTQEAQIAIKNHTHPDTTCVKRNIEVLKHIINYCQERNINLTLITTPTWHSYYENLDLAQLAEMYRIVEHLEVEYNIAYYDFLKDERFTADDFINADHLNEDGANKLTQILNTQIFQPKTIK